MELSAYELKRSMTVSAAMPFDTLQDALSLAQECDQYLGIAVLPTFIKTLRASMNAELPCRLVGLVGYPSGAVTCSTKVTEIRQLIYQGCNAFNIVANTALMLSEDWDEVECDLYSTIKTVKGLPITVTLESSYLSAPQLEKVAGILRELEVEAVSTSSGWLPILPNLATIAILQAQLGENVAIEVAGIQNYEQLAVAQAAGARRFMVRKQHAEAIFALIES